MCLQVGYSHQTKPKASFRRTSSHFSNSVQLRWSLKYTLLRPDNSATSRAQEGLKTYMSCLTTLHSTFIFHCPFSFVLGLDPILFHRVNVLNSVFFPLEWSPSAFLCISAGSPEAVIVLLAILSVIPWLSCSSDPFACFCSFRPLPRSCYRFPCLFYPGDPFSSAFLDRLSRRLSINRLTMNCFQVINRWMDIGWSNLFPFFKNNRTFSLSFPSFFPHPL